MATNQFFRPRDAKPVVEMGTRPRPPVKPYAVPKAGPPAMPLVLSELLKSKPKRGSAFYGD